MISYPIKQSSTSQPLLFLLVSSSDHNTPVTGASPTVKISKSGATGVSPSGAVSEVDATNMPGWYKVAGNATDTNTLGPLVLHATAAGADPCDVLYPVVAFDPQVATNLGLSALPTANPAASGGLPTVGTGSGQVNPSSGKVPATLASTDVTGNVAADLQTIKTQAVTCSGGVTVPAATLASTTNITAATGVTVSGTVSANVTQIAGQTASAAAGVTFPATIASTTNITAASGITLAAVTHTGATIPAVTTVTNLTNAPTSGDLTATMKASVTTAATAATPTISLPSTAPTGWIVAASFAANAITAAALASDAATEVATAVMTSLGSTNVGFSGGTDVTYAECLRAAWAQGKGKWTIVGTTMTIYCPDGSTIYKAFTLDSATAPTQRY